MQASVRLGRVAGVEIGVNWSWLVVFALITWSLGAVVFPETNPGLADGAYVAMAAVAAALFFAALLLHELGHAVVARREGMEIDGIVLWLFGGVARFKGMFPSAGAELRIALAGPAVTVAIAAALLALAVALPLPSGVDGVVMWLGTINVFLLVFNLLPALPLDGGRVLRAALWQAWGDFTEATRVAGAIGRGFGWAMVAGGVALLFALGAASGLWLALIGWFLIAAAGAEASLATIRSALGSLRVGDAMASRPTTVPAEMTLSEFADGPFAATRHAAYPVLDDGGRVVGLLGFRDVAAVEPARWDAARVRALARPLDDVLTLAPGDDLGTAASELVADDLRRALVLDDGRLAGLLSMTDVARLIELREHRARRPA
jgi:Zn-dependent protease